MTIKMKAAFAGVDFTVSVGDVTDRFSHDEELRMIDAGYAEQVEDTPDRETAEQKPIGERRTRRGK